jgi:hypothetical protein
MKAVGARGFAPRVRSGAVDSQGACCYANAAAIGQSGQTKKEATGGKGEAMERDALGLGSSDPCGKLSVPGRRRAASDGISISSNATLGGHSRTLGIGPRAMRMKYEGIYLGIVMPYTKVHALPIHEEI